jgi:hypothetical protein
MKRGIYLILITIVLLLWQGCGIFDENGDDVTDPDDRIYTLTATASPAEAGIVEPSEAEFDEGSQVSVEALANEGWEFIEWTGDFMAEDNPLIFTIGRNTELTANFIDISSVYSVDLTVSDEANSLDLAFGQDPDPSALDEEAPPPPPADALHAYFDRNGENLFGDFRNFAEKQVVWKLNFQVGTGEELTLSWSVDAGKMDGVLSLLANDGTVLAGEVSGDGSYMFTASDYAYVEFRYELE